MQASRWILIVATAVFSAAALAHHGWSEYDQDKPLTETGIIKEYGYDNPHGFIKLEVSGKLRLVILAPPSRMTSRGLPKDALKAGNTVTVVGYQNRAKAEEMRAERITFEGKTVELR